MMRRCKLEFLIFFNLAILKQQKKKKNPGLVKMESQQNNYW